MEYIGINKEELLNKLPRLYRFVPIDDAKTHFNEKYGIRTTSNTLYNHATTHPIVLKK